MTPDKTTHTDDALDDGLPDPIEPPEVTRDEGWQCSDEPLVDRRMTTYTIRLPKRDVARLRAIASQRGEPATRLLREWVLDALAVAERPAESSASVRAELSRIQKVIDRAMRDARAAVDAVAKSMAAAQVESGREGQPGTAPTESRRSTPQAAKSGRTGRYVKSEAANRAPKSTKSGRVVKRSTSPSGSTRKS